MLNSYSFPSPLNSHLFPCEVKFFPPFQFLPSPLRDNEKALKPSSSPSVSLFPFDCRKYLVRVIKKESRDIGMGKSGTSRTKSRQPVKHYKKLLSEIFPKSLNSVRNMSSLKML
ncbi:hypothetical protein ES332_A03G195000v1 [Gossypium tomentosum]|uniref:Uncharacterized protein n=1 Tax=Gossypium tomentosum TaxID=34277 RepID=A0A5D2R8X9_GOSTO|nr:hypothetical protein ES332_A03G195000v1 [Gossypium tomentosum]